ncbi:MAG: UPF0280 family protein [Candidatus Omnitrophica bacterium]|nr:UPF0280 family protein [Candidatus Omnitrophota bacterium]MCM8827411.1 UPF0280 family protein [Candidatus Omnitrophota bacterium]
MYEERFYRYYCSKKEYNLDISYKESDLYIVSDKPLEKNFTLKILVKYYNQIKDYIKKNPHFLTSLSPLPIDEQALPIVKDMLLAGKISAVGPFASVAGAIAFYVGKELLNYCNQIIIENGGDVFLKIDTDIIMGVYLGDNFNPKNLTIKVSKRNSPFGICSSSAKIGHSLNFGCVDLLTVISKDVIVADALATAYSNEIKKEKDVKNILNQARQNPYVDGIIVAFRGKLFLWGDIELT